MLLRAARWRAARHGIAECLFDPLRAVLVDARSAVSGLLTELEDDLRRHDEWAEVEALVEQLFARGTSATRQRQAERRTGQRRDVAAWVVAQGAVRRD